MIETLRNELMDLAKSSPTLQGFRALRAFLKGPGCGTKSIGSMDDPILLQKLIDICKQGEEVIIESIKPYLEKQS